MKFTIFDHPGAASTGIGPQFIDYLVRWKNLSKTPAEAASWLAAQLSDGARTGRCRIHIQNLFSTRREPWSVATPDGRARSTDWLEGLREELPDDLEIKSVTLDDLFDRGFRAEAGMQLWLGFWRSGWLDHYARGCEFGAYGHFGTFGTHGQPVVYMKSRRLALRAIRKQKWMQPRHIWPWVVAPGVYTTSFGGEWTSEALTSMLQLLRSEGIERALVYTGGPNGGTRWGELWSVLENFLDDEDVVDPEI